MSGSEEEREDFGPPDDRSLLLRGKLSSEGGSVSPPPGAGLRAEGC